ncbi:MAG TPA: alkaline phosphatase family protein [Terriglobales bacterium]
MRQILAVTMMIVSAIGPLLTTNIASAQTDSALAVAGRPATPIKHLVIVFQENVSFDHYFGTYPNARNPRGEPSFQPFPNTPTVNGLAKSLLVANPNLNLANGSGATNPFRLDRSQVVTSDQDHDYGPEQAAFDGGVMDLFPLNVGTPGPPPGAPPIALTTGLNMGYFDGNTVTALWHYAQYYSLNDNFYGTTFGPSTPGALNLISGQTNGVTRTLNGTGDEVDGGNGSLTVIGDPDPVGDICSNATRNQVQMGGRNIGDLLNAAHVTWGSFMGGFNLAVVNPNGTTGCTRSSTSLAGTTGDYIPHHAWFQYYASTANPTHARPKSIANIGKSGDPANHQYDLADFYAAVSAGNFPAVSFIKAAAYQDGHAGYSDPLDEQTFVVHLINFLQGQPEWTNTAVVIMYDDSDGWYDHQLGQIVNQSQTAQDALNGAGFCGKALPILDGVTGPHAQGRCGYGPRQPFLVVGPYAKHNFVDHTMADQSSVLRFIEDNWLAGERVGQGSFDAIASPINSMFDFRQNIQNDLVLLNESTGEVIFASSPAIDAAKAYAATLK